MKFDGYKTYIVAIGTLMFAIGGFASGKLEINVAMELILGALGLSGLRHAVSKKQD